MIPKPSAYLDPLTEVDSCYFYSVPKFFPMDHSNTRWILSTVRADNVDKFRRKIELRPDLFRSGYYQLLDSPQLYHCRDPNAAPMFHKKAVLYLTAVGIAIYLRSTEILKLLFEYKDPSGEQVFKINDPQYATHVQDSVNGDFHSYPLSLVMIRSGFFESATQLLAAGWNPLESICMPIRRRCQRQAIYYHDWLDYVLCLMQEKPLLSIQKLVQCMICDHQLRKYKETPMSVLLPESDEARIPTGIMNVDDLQDTAQMIGVRSLLDIAEDYSIYLQTKERHQMVQDCIRQMVCEGVNPEVMMAFAQDFDGYEGPTEVRGAVARGSFADNRIFDTSNANNNAASDRSKKKNNIEDAPYASEPTRILYFALQCGAKKGCKVPLLPLLDSVAEYIRRDFFLIQPLPTVGKKERDKSSKSLEVRYDLRKRDAKNTIALLLNLMQSQSDRLEGLNQALLNQRPKFKHLDVSKLAHNKRIVIIRNIRRIGDLLFRVLLHSGEFLHFVKAEYPPYTHFKGGQVDFAPNPNLQLQLGAIQLEVMTEFNKSKTALRYLDMNGLIIADRMKELVLNLRLGKKPTMKEISASKKLQKGAQKGSRNASNVTGSAPGIEVAQRFGNNAATSDGILADLHFGDPGSYLRDAIGQAVSSGGGRVTFVKVKRKPKHKKAEENGSTPEESVSEATEVATGPTEESRSDLAFRLAEQIAELGRTALDGTSVTRKLVEIYNLILGDLSQIPCVKALLGSAALDGVEAAESEAKPESDREEELVGPCDAANQEMAEEIEAMGTELKHRLRLRRGIHGSGIRRKPRRTGTRTVGCSGLQSLNYQVMKVVDSAPDGTEFALD